MIKEIYWNCQQKDWPDFTYEKDQIVTLSRVSSNRLGCHLGSQNILHEKKKMTLSLIS